MEKYEKVLELMKQKNGRLEVTDPDLKNLLTEKLMYRVSVYMSCIRRLSKLEVRAIRDGRKVTAYELVAVAPAPAAVAETTEPQTAE